MVPSSHKPAEKISVSEGRAQLTAARFKHEVVFGPRAELWVNKNGYPVTVSYFGSDSDFFSKESLDIALSLKDERLI
jgi:hypothetical protein